MANMYWRGNSLASAQIHTFTPDVSPSTGDLYAITATDDEGHSYSASFLVAGTETVKAVVEGLKAAADAHKAAGIGPWDEITATEDDAVLTLTVDTAGKPVYYSTSLTTPGTLTAATVASNYGPYDWNDLGNWDGDGDLPGADASDVVYVENAVIKYGLNQSAISNALTALYITKSQIGQNSIDNLPPSYLQIKASKVDINYNNDPGAISLLSPVNVSTGSTASEITVFNAASASNVPSVNLLAASASTNINILLGAVGIANNANETATVGAIKALGGSCYIGAGVTLASLLNRVCATIVRCAMTTLTMDSGTVKTDGTGAIGTVDINGGTATLNSGGTITALNAIKGAADFSKSTTARTVTTAKIGSGGSIKYDPSIVTMTNKVQPYNSSGDLTLTAA